MSSTIPITTTTPRIARPALIHSGLDRTAIGALVLVCAAALCGCSEPDDRFDRIVFVSIDTLRADHLGTYGYPRSISPFIDRMAEDGAVFERAFASMPTTGPSHATMFTGLHPIQHGVFRNGRRLDDDSTTLAELVSKRGFDTAGFSGTRAHFRAGNLDQGFDHFDEPPVSAGGLYRAADETLQAASTWLRTQPNDRPLFLMLHLFDVHHPWNPPEEHRRQVAGRSLAVGFEASYWNQTHQIPIDFYSDQVDQMRTTIDAYDAEIHFADAELSRFATDFAKWADDQTTLWIITSDHGEGLGNHGWLFHGKHIYNEQVRVPLIFYSTDRRFAGRRIKPIVQHVDLLPTLLDLAADPSSPTPEDNRPEATDAHSGRSLVALLQGAPNDAVDSPGALIQRRRFDPNPDADARALRGELHPDNRYEPGDTYGWIQGDWKFIHRTMGTDELFDLASDPYEMQNLASPHAERVQRMKSSLDARLAELKPATQPTAPPVSSETQTRLEALGYLP